jgi:phosphatidylethanolamine-binding protein (PEBP) family uncharacterized protein
MKHPFPTLCAFLFLFSVIAGCATTKVNPSNAVSLRVEFTWASTTRCSSVSPEIKIAGIPSNTEQLNVKMIDLDKMDFNHGGGTVKYEGSNVITVGALKSYKGPCPWNQPHDYSIQIEAVDVSGVIVGFGEKTLKCCN